MQYNMPTFSLDWLKHQLSYDPDTGIFTWRVTRKGCKKGRPAGYKDKEGYVNIRLKKKLWAAHRLAVWYMTGYYPQPDEVVDHINGIRSDNRISNLRILSKSQNAINRAKAKTHKRATSKYIGVYRLKNGYWRAQIEVNGKVEVSPWFMLEIDAAMWRVQKEAEVHGEYAQKDNVKRLLKEIL